MVSDSDLGFGFSFWRDEELRFPHLNFFYLQIHLTGFSAGYISRLQLGPRTVSEVIIRPVETGAQI